MRQCLEGEVAYDEPALPGVDAGGRLVLLLADSGGLLRVWCGPQLQHILT